MNQLAEFLVSCRPFDSLCPAEAAAAADAAAVSAYGPGELVLDAFAAPTGDVYVIIEGQIELWYDASRLHLAPDDRFGVGQVFGFSAMLTDRAVGPRAVTSSAARIARIPAALVRSAFASESGATFLAEHVSHMHRWTAEKPTYSMVDDLIVSTPLVVTPDARIREVARSMTESGLPCAIVDRDDGGYGLINDAMLRRWVIVDGTSVDTPLSSLVIPRAPVTTLGKSAAEALIDLLDSAAEFLVVTDLAGGVRGVVNAKDFVISPSTAGASTHELIKRARTIEQLAYHSADVPTLLGNLLHGGLAASRVIAVYSAIVDTIVRRAIDLVFESHPALSVDAFTWLSLGSNGRREAVPGSDVDAAVGFSSIVTASEMYRYRTVFGEMESVLQQCGISVDEHGASPRRRAFSRANRDWRAAAQRWITEPTEEQGVVMTSLLVDGRPIHGDPGLPEVNRVFTELRSHHGTMELLLQESLSHKARMRGLRGVLLPGRAERFDLKQRALLPLVNVARWAALAAGSTELHTPQRLRAAAGSKIMPASQAERLVEAFDALQDLRLRQQLDQLAAGREPSDVFDRRELSAIERSVVSEAVREIAAVQRRMENVAGNLPIREWTR